jgi:hypothetical protein
LEIFFLCILTATEEKSRIQIRIRNTEEWIRGTETGSGSKRHGSEMLSQTIQTIMGLASDIAKPYQI